MTKVAVSTSRASLAELIKRTNETSVRITEQSQPEPDFDDQAGAKSKP
jgi:PHD/YefM family antitoxin component YafN of YafNO toxin-antitoxin module